MIERVKAGRRTLAPLAALTAGWLLAGCVAEGNPPPQVTPGQPAAEQNREMRSAAAGLPPLAKEVGESPDRLVGLSPGEISEILGNPTLRRRETKAELWQFAHGACILDLHLYPEGEVLKVGKYLFRGSRGAKIQPKTCLNNMIDNHFRRLPLG